MVSWLKSLENIQNVLIIHIISHCNVGACQGSILLSSEKKLIFAWFSDKRNTTKEYCKTLKAWQGFLCGWKNVVLKPEWNCSWKYNIKNTLKKNLNHGRKNTFINVQNIWTYGLYQHVLNKHDEIIIMLWKWQLLDIRNNLNLFLMLILTLIRFPLCLDLCLLGVDIFISCSYPKSTSAFVRECSTLASQKGSYLKLEDLLGLPLFLVEVIKNLSVGMSQV